MARENYRIPTEFIVPEEIYESYEDLFEDEDSNAWPCYLPEENNSKLTREVTIERNNVRVSVDKDGDCSPRMALNGAQSVRNEEHITLNEGHLGMGLDEGKIKEEILDIETEISPSRSGYAAENGGSSASGLSSAIGEGITSQLRKCNGRHGNGAKWMPGKRHENEFHINACSSWSNTRATKPSWGMQDDTSLSWRRRKKHFFILSHAGKPIYSRYGNEHKLAGFSTTLQAIISFAENSGDHIRLVQAGNHQIVFLVKDLVYLVCISLTKEPLQALKGQLELLYSQMLLILTKSVEKCFEKNAKFDMRSLLGGTNVVFSSLIHAFSWNPATFLHAYTCLPLSYATRQAANASLQDIVDSKVIFAMLMCKHKVISIAAVQKATLHPDDILLLSNFVASSDSFRTSESFSPICLPQYNPMTFLYAYVQYLEGDTFLMLLTTESNTFFHLRECRIHIEMVLNKSNVLNEVKTSMLDNGLHVENLPGDMTLHPEYVHGYQRQDKEQEPTVARKGVKTSSTVLGGAAGLWHFIYRSTYLDQYVASEFSPPLNTRRAEKRLLRAYQNLYASMHHGVIGPHKMQYRRDENYILLCWITQDFELYAAFDPLAEKSLAVTVCNRVCHWLRDVETEIFLLDASPFLW